MDKPTREAQLLGELVAIPSINPRSGSSATGETQVAQYIQRWAARRGFDVELIEVSAGRSNAIVRIPGTEAGCILLQSHTDTVETDGMSVEPFTLTSDDGRWYGRGSCDAKGQLAAFMTAIERVTGAIDGHHSIVLAACVDEEEHYRGVTALCANGLSGIGEDTIGAVVGEPSELRCVVAHKGVLRGSITARGAGGHSSRPTESENPINTMAEVICHLAGPVVERLASDRHPLLGSASLIVTMIEGGEAINIIPRQVTARYDRRTLPAEDPQEVWAQLKDELESRWPSVTVAEPSLIDHGLDSAPDSPFVSQFTAVLDRLGLEAEPVGAPFGSDASKIARLGIDCVVFGAGSISKAHTADEFIPDTELTAAVDVIASLLSGTSEQATP